MQGAIIEGDVLRVGCFVTVVCFEVISTCRLMLLFSVPFICLTWLPDGVERLRERFALMLFLMLGGGIVRRLVFGLLVIDVVVVGNCARCCLLLLNRLVLEVTVLFV